MDHELVRSSEDSMIAGVCGGLGDYTGIDSTLIRLGWVLLTLISSGWGIVLYLIAWFVIPSDDGEHAPLPVLLVLVFIALPTLCALCCSLTSLVFGLGGALFGV
ncbi:MAG: PspC domain-containing protein [Anaerolineae bacterium]